MHAKTLADPANPSACTALQQPWGDKQGHTHTLIRVWRASALRHTAGGPPALVLVKRTFCDFMPRRSICVPSLRADRGRPCASCSSLKGQ